MAASHTLNIGRFPVLAEKRIPAPPECFAPYMDMLGDLWSRGKIGVARQFPGDWEEDFFRSQRRFLPEPEPVSEETLFWSGGYWAQITSRRSLSLPYLEMLWVDPESGMRYYALPASLLRPRGQGAALLPRLGP